MNRILSLLAIGFLWLMPTPRAYAQESVSMDFFYDNLEPYGNWREIEPYGYCWQPNDVTEEWRPFSDGRWVYTDAGWTWDSNEAFGWAVFHYGRWANVVDIGWIWVPGMEWGPAWVSWRHSENYIGWAPLPPEANFRLEIGFHGWVDDYYDIGPSNYSFVETQNFGARRLGTVFIDSRRNQTIIRETTNITNIYYENNLVRNSGPRYEVLAKVTRNPIGRYQLDRRQRFESDPREWREEHGRSRVSENSFSLFAPSFSNYDNAKPRKPRPKVDRAEINRGWRHAGSEPEIDALRKAIRSKATPPAELPRQPKFIKPSERADRPERPDTEVRPGKPVKDQPPVTPKIEPKMEDRPPVTIPKTPKPDPNDAPKPDRPRTDDQAPGMPKKEPKKEDGPAVKNPETPKADPNDAPKPDRPRTDDQAPGMPKKEPKKEDGPAVKNPETPKADPNDAPKPDRPRRDDQAPGMPKKEPKKDAPPVKKLETSRPERNDAPKPERKDDQPPVMPKKEDEPKRGDAPRPDRPRTSDPSPESEVRKGRPSVRPESAPKPNKPEPSKPKAITPPQAEPVRPSQPNREVRPAPPQQPKREEKPAPQKPATKPPVPDPKLPLVPEGDDEERKGKGKGKK